DNTVKAWDTRTGKELFTRKGHTAVVLSLAFSPDGTRLASAGGFRGEPDPGEVIVWDAETGERIFTIKGLPSGFPSVVFSPDGKLLACARLGFPKFGKKGLAPVGSQVTVWRAQTGKKLYTIKGGGGPVVFSPDGQRLADHSKAWDAQTGKEVL